MELDAVQGRVLGALVEKEITTPESYPLSLNALVNACNQKQSREPVMALEEHEVRDALRGLEDLRLAMAARGDSRVTKYEHRMRDVLNLRRDEVAVICLLLLRGPQTPGELRTRSERMFAFADLLSVQETLERLVGRELVVALGKRAGEKEVRFATRLMAVPDVAAAPVRESSRGELERVVAELVQRVERLERLADVGGAAGGDVQSED